MRQPHDIVQAGVRLPESLRRKLEREAKRHHVSLNREIRMRLEDSLERQDAPRLLDDIAQDMDRCWGRYSTRFMMLTLEDQLAAALMKTKDPEVASLAQVWLHTRDIGRRHEEGRVS
jgi:hypothetical protein